MHFLLQTDNPVSAMKEFDSLWYVLIVVLIACGILIVILRPLHRYWTDRKTRAIIRETGDAGPPDEPGEKGDAVPKGGEKE
jgi:uncharacterized membrane protein YqiK